MAHMFRTWLTLTAVAVALSSCSGAVSKSAPTEPESTEPESAEPELPAIVGTWQSEGYRIVDDPFAADPVQIGRGEYFLTFTESRYIEVFIEHFDDGRDEDEVVTGRSGGYRIDSDGVIVRIASHLDDDDMLVTEEFIKTYELVDDGNLNMEPWGAVERLAFEFPYETRRNGSVVHCRNLARDLRLATRVYAVYPDSRFFVSRMTGTYSAIDDYTRIDADGRLNWIQ